MKPTTERFFRANYTEPVTAGNALAGTGKLEKAMRPTINHSLLNRLHCRSQSLSMLVKYAPSDHMAAVSELIKCPDIDDEAGAIFIMQPLNE